MVLSGINPEDRKRYEKLFKKLDVNNNGKIDLHDLKVQLGCEKYAQVSYMFHPLLLTHFSYLNFDDFMNYLESINATQASENGVKS